MTTTNNIHGHDLLRLVQQANPPFTRAALEDEARRRWGADARYCTCSTADMTLTEMLDFLLARQKLALIQGQLHAILANMCNHDDHDKA